MRIWHDRSYIGEDSKLLIERGFAAEDLYSLRLSFNYTEEERAEYRRFVETHTAEERNADNAKEARRRSDAIYEVVKAVAKEFVCYQFDHELEMRYDDARWDLFFWCNNFHNTMHGYGLTGRDYSYVTLTFNERHSPAQRQAVCDRVLELIQREFPNHPNLDLAIQHDVQIDQKKLDDTVSAVLPNLLNRPCTYARMEGKVVQTSKGIFFLKKRARKYGYRLSQVDLLRLSGHLPQQPGESEVRYA